MVDSCHALFAWKACQDQAYAFFLRFVATTRLVLVAHRFPVDLSPCPLPEPLSGPPVFVHSDDRDLISKEVICPKLVGGRPLGDYACEAISGRSRDCGKIQPTSACSGNRKDRAHWSPCKGWSSPIGAGS